MATRISNIFVDYVPRVGALGLTWPASENILLRQKKFATEPVEIGTEKICAPRFRQNRGIYFKSAAARAFEIAEYNQHRVIDLKPFDAGSVANWL